MDALVFDYNCKWETASLSHAGVQHPSPKIQDQAVDLPNEALQTPSTELQWAVSAMEIQTWITKVCFPLNPFFLLHHSYFMKRISNFVQIFCPYINFPQGSSGHLPTIKLRNTRAQQRQPEETEIWKAVHLMWLTWWKTSTQNLTYKFFSDLPESVNRKLLFAHSLSDCNFPLFLNVFMPRWLMPSERLTAGLGTILLPAS